MPLPDLNAVPVPKTRDEAAEQLTGLPFTLGVKPSLAYGAFASQESGRFGGWLFMGEIEPMLEHPDVKLPYSYYKSGISSVKFKVKAGTQQQAEYAHQFFSRFWERSRKDAQRSYDYGWLGSEIVYKFEDRLLQYEGLRPLHPLDCYALTRRGVYQGFSVNAAMGGAQLDAVRQEQRKLWGPGRWPAKGLWLTHDARWHRWYGTSQLVGAWRPWRRLVPPDALEEILDGAIYRYAYAGLCVRYPSGDFRKKDGSGDVDYDAARNEARQMAEQLKAGGSIALPNDRDAKGEFKWLTEWPSHVLDVDPLLNAEKALQQQISRGCGVPPELIEASESGSGWSGRKIPLLGFYTNQVDEARNIVWQAKVQILDPLIRWNFGPKAWCDVEVEIDLPKAIAGNPESASPGAQPPGEKPPEKSAGMDDAASVAGGSDPAKVKGGGKGGMVAELSTLASEPSRARTFTLAAEIEDDNSDDPDEVVDEILSSVRRLSREARQALLADLARTSIEHAAAVLRRWVERWHGELAEMLTDARLAATLKGMQALAARIEPTEQEQTAEQATVLVASDSRLPLIDLAAQSLREKRVLIPDDFELLRNAARQQAFTVAGAETEAVVAKVKDALIKAVEQGSTLKTFKTDVEAAVGEGSFLSPAHAETVFRTAVLGAYSDGQERLLENPAVGDLFPYAIYTATHDDRVRPEHLAMEAYGIGGGSIYRRDDPVYQLFRAPWSWNCRCVCTPITIRQAARKGVEEAKLWLETGVPPTRPAWVPMPPFRPDPKFDRATDGETTLSTDAEGHEHDAHGLFASKSGPDKVSHLKNVDRPTAHKLLAGHNTGAIRELQRHAKAPMTGKRADLLAHLHASRSPAPASAPAGNRAAHAQAVHDAFEQLAEHHHGFVPLDAIHAHVGGSLQDLHVAIDDLRRQGKLTGSQDESRGGIRPSLVAAAILASPSGTPIHYVSKRQGKELGTDVKLSTDAQGHEHAGKGPHGGEFISKGSASGEGKKPEQKSLLTNKGEDSSAKSKEEVAPEKPKKPKALRGEMMSARREGTGKDARVILADGSEAPAHIKPSMVAPDWKDVSVSLDPDADVLVTAKDGKGRGKTVYSDSWDMRQAAAKFARTKEGLEKFDAMYQQNQENRENPKLREQADCVWLMQEQATRPGSEADNKGTEKLYGAKIHKDDVLDEDGRIALMVPVRRGEGESNTREKVYINDKKTRAELLRRLKSGEDLEDSTYWLKSFGATTLEARHVQTDESGDVFLRFVGKESVFHNHKIRNPKLAKMLLERKDSRGPDEKLFSTSDGQVSAYTKKLDGGAFSPKDFRTQKATSLAVQEIGKMEIPKDEKDYKAQVKRVGEIVSGVLGNEPAQALASYIDPTVFSGWRAGLQASPEVELSTDAQGHEHADKGPHGGEFTKKGADAGSALPASKKQPGSGKISKPLVMLGATARSRTSVPPDRELPADMMQPMNSASPELQAAVNTYTSSQYLAINRHLRQGFPATAEQKKTAERLRETFTSLQPFEKPVPCWRGLSMNESETRQLLAKLENAARTKEAVEFGGFQSSSLDPGTAVGFSENRSSAVVFEITASKGLYLDDHSSTPGERELLFDHNSRFRVTAIKEVPFKTSAGNIKKKVVQLEQLS